MLPFPWIIMVSLPAFMEACLFLKHFLCPYLKKAFNLSSSCFCWIGDYKWHVGVSETQCRCTAHTQFNIRQCTSYCSLSVSSAPTVIFQLDYWGSSSCFNGQASHDRGVGQSFWDQISHMTSVLRAMSSTQVGNHMMLKSLISKSFSVLNCSHEMFLTIQPLFPTLSYHSANAAKANYR